MNEDRFNFAWARRLRHAIDADERYARVGARWTGRVALRRTDGDQAGVVLDLAEGRCEGFEVFTGPAPQDCRAAIAGPDRLWDAVVSGELDPILALARGQLTLERGTMIDLMPHAASARIVVELARAVDLEVGARDRSPAAPPPLVPRAPADPDAPPRRRGFATLQRGLDHESVPMRLFQQAKRHGIWDPRGIDFMLDVEDWLRIDDAQRELLLHLLALFQAGEEAVTLDLLPLMRVIAREGRIEEEMYLTSVLFEEAKHVEVFQRFFDEVAPSHGDLSRFETPSYERIFLEELPDVLGALDRDDSPVAQARAAVSYNMIVEGVLAEAGYRTCHQLLETHAILPGLQDAFRLLRRDEARHVAWGLHLVSRIVAENGEPVWRAVERRMTELLDPAMTLIQEVFALHDPMPFGLRADAIHAEALGAFQTRMKHLEQAWIRRRPLDTRELEALVPVL